MRETAKKLFLDTQRDVVLVLEALDRKSKFRLDNWLREDESGQSGGGGITQVIKAGAIFEQGGVNFSEVHGLLPADMSEKLVGIAEDTPFYATGISLVLHPYSPQVPTTHANYRYLEVGGKHWFGGGQDLTPFYLYEEDAEHFHRSIKGVLDRHDRLFYPRFKKWCDEYFYLPHRQECRGIGGIFFDYLGRDDPRVLESTYRLVSDLCGGFLESYIPIVERRRELPFSKAEKQFQLLRRGRYVEFNLIYDRGTLFGLKTKGRTESILMSLPPEVKWEYGVEYPPGTKEAKLIDVLQNPRDWVK